MIDRKEVIDGLKILKDNLPIIDLYGYGDHNYFATAIVNDAIALLKERPEIVRCKDCKHYPNGDGSTKWLPCMEIITPPGWYCADWEAR